MRKRLHTSSNALSTTMFQLMILIFLTINILSATSLTTHATPNIECRGHSRKYKTLDPDGNPVCVPCSSCSPGYGVLRPCTEYQDTVCEACEPGKTFSGTDSTWRRCESCVQCATHELRRRECTPTRNGRCGSCETGWFHNDITGDCDVCSWCYPEYPAITDFVSGCNVTGVTPGFQCAPILDAPYPPPLELHLHVTTEETSHRAVEALDHHHLIEYVGEEDHSHGANEELEKSTHCTPTKSPPFAQDITTEHLIDSVRMLTGQVSLAPQASNRRLSGQSGQDHKITGHSVLTVAAIVGIAVAISTLMIIILVVCSIKRRARACLLEGNESLIELPMSESPTDKTPLVENHEDVAYQNTISTII